MGLFVVRLLCNDTSASLPQALLQQAADALRTTSFRILVNSNPRSREKVETGDYCIRANPNRVDLNRNWDSHWREHGSCNDVEWGGPNAFSEAETRLFRDVLTTFRPRVMATIHSGNMGLYHPYAFSRSAALSWGAQKMHTWLRQLSSATVKVPFGPAAILNGGDCPGSGLDFAYDTLKSYSFALEIFLPESERPPLRSRYERLMNMTLDELLERERHGEALVASSWLQLGQGEVVSAASSEGEMTAAECLAFFNPTDEGTYWSVLTQWTDVLFRLTDLVGRDGCRGGLGCVS
ncbi:unnamed protein product [Vitrella brassicaformis CCMP3155]|uniref:Peptidase M14 domain-containing protein n=1 Tax=Vitrella brassicaformis (strain CCMP3155) TaxID=1169540 RepID=A0A0G4EE83_VITBC|nr:unnamed protein product [Vitrella brassicaformis CCMP3155]|mmetsp:Transcript_23082/g.57059  ORF Transcript_23082/g.57059 Transcript_23082/m.57059 type:complete len:293 (-) Transcript_23082:1357-2235(-)|eukprot:CEL93864.1 unnamed protein product [Vitrella brassicaformis CCMP3155]